MARAEFSKKTREAAFERSGGLCEASGARYGLPDGQRCNAPIKNRAVYDHDDPDANSKDNGLENCRAICAICHEFKTDKVDKPMIAKTVRMRQKNRSIRGPKGRGFQKMPAGYHWDWERGRAVCDSVADQA